MKGTCVYLWLMHVDVWQKPTQYCRAIILQLKNKIFFKLLKKKRVGQKHHEIPSQQSW